MARPALEAARPAGRRARVVLRGVTSPLVPLALLALGAVALAAEGSSTGAVAAASAVAGVALSGST
jgi:hypothetical protein